MSRLDAIYGPSLPVEVLEGVLPAEFSPIDLEDADLGALESDSIGDLGSLEGDFEEEDDSDLEGLPLRPQMRQPFPGRASVPKIKRVPRPGPQNKLDHTRLNAQRIPPGVLKQSPGAAVQRTQMQFKAPELKKLLVNPAFMTKGKAQQAQQGNLVGQMKPAAQSGAVVGQMKPKNWLDRVSKKGTPTKKFTLWESWKASMGLPSALVKKAKEVAKGGFIGGKVGKKAKEVRAQMVKNEAIRKALETRASRINDPVESSRLRTQANKVQAKVLSDRVRVERFRHASLLKVYEMIKKQEAQKARSKAKATKGSEQERHLFNSAKNIALANKAKEAFTKLMTEKQHVPALKDEVKKFSTPSTVKESLTKAGKNVVPPHLRHKMMQMPKPYNRQVEVPKAKIPTDLAQRSSSRTSLVAAIVGYQSMEGLGEELFPGGGLISTGAKVAGKVAKGDVTGAMLTVASEGVKAVVGGGSKSGGSQTVTEMDKAYPDWPKGTKTWAPFKRISNDGRDRAYGPLTATETETWKKAALAAGKTKANGWPPDVVEQGKRDLAAAKEMGRLLDGGMIKDPPPSSSAPPVPPPMPPEPVDDSLLPTWAPWAIGGTVAAAVVTGGVLYWRKRRG